MTECWSHGDLRAAIDRELPAEALERIAAHLDECSDCRAVHAELEARARRVGLLMEDLATVQPSVEPARITGRRRLWPAVLALAAGLAIGWIVLPKKHVDLPAPPVPPPEVAKVSPTPQAPVPVAQAEPRPRSRRGRPVRKAPAPAPQTVDFVALDDRPIDNGVVMRVSWGPENLQADIIFGPDGSARAYRLVNANYRY